MRYRDRNLKRLLDAYLEKAKRGEGKERASVKEVIGRAIRKARGLPSRGSTAHTFNPSDVFEDAARLCAQRQPNDAIKLLRKEAGKCEATIAYARHQLRLAQQRAATAFLEIGFIMRDQGREWTRSKPSRTCSASTQKTWMHFECEPCSIAISGDTTRPNETSMPCCTSYKVTPQHLQM